MIKTVLLLHFLMGTILPFVATRINNALADLKHNSEWLNNGYIQHEDYRITQYNVLKWLGISVGYLCLYMLILYVSIQLLSIN